MKMILSRKGFDSAAGKCPSPIIDGRPVSMPIPATTSSTTTYADLDLGGVVERITRGRMSADQLCHHDPMFYGGECLLGQCGAAQSHLARHGIGPGDVFLFFGLFADPDTGERHHRIFGYFKVRTATPVDALSAAEHAELVALQHPHVLDRSVTNDVIYRGEGVAARQAHDSLRMTRPGGPLSQWRVPPWLEAKGLSYHAKPWRWAEPGYLQLVSRGQEFVCDIGENAEACDWIDAKIEAIHT
jgi:hypothetical protein